MLSRAVFIALGLACMASAERPGIASGEMGLLGAVALPVSTFAGEERGEGHARPGLGGGMDFLAHLTLPYLAWSSGLYYFWNPTESDDFSSAVSLGSWLNVPLVSGVRVQTGKLGGNARLYGQIQAGANLASQTDTEGPGARIEVGWTTSLGFSVGAGAIINDRIHVGARFFHLGEPEYTFKANINGSRAETGTQEPRVVALMLGVYFDATN